MKKLFLIFTLILSSFFFYFDNVKADEINITVSDDAILLINEDFFKVRDLVIEFAEENNYNYLIYYTDKFHVYYFDIDNFNFFKTTTSGTNIPTLQVLQCGANGKLYYYENEILNYGRSFSSQCISSYLYYNLNIIDDYSSFLDTNIEIFNNISDDIKITYKNYTFSILENNKLPTLYDFYINTLEEEDVHLEEKQLLSNFYTLVIEKLDLLTTSITNNYIYLSVIGILILIFVIELILRRLI